MKFKMEMYNHQIKAFEKTNKLKIGALYMEMGTGKTRVALELIDYRLRMGKIKKVLWLCPCSIIEDMFLNIWEHTDETEMIYIYGIESLSQSDRLYLQLLDFVSSGDVMLVVDESNLVKNYFAKRTQRITTLAEHCQYKLILNGTPISKNEADLFAQWYILDYRILGYKSFYSFSANHLEYDDYGNVRRVLNIDYLTEKIAPYSYTLKKSECLKLPPKHYHTEYYHMTDEQEFEYEHTKRLLLDNVNEFDSTTIYKLFTGLQQIVSGNKIIRINPLISKSMFDDPFKNPRIQKLIELVEDIDGKAIIWCKFTPEIENVKYVLNKIYGECSTALFYGKLKLKSRAVELDKFRKEARFLIGNKSCGGYGLNLQFCNNMIYYSNDFNWATRAQSEDRVHRIGQKKDVNIYDICAWNKIDIRILNNLCDKENLADALKRELTNNRDKVSEWIDGGINDTYRIIS